MNEQVLTIVVGLIIAALGATGLWSYLSTRHRPPIERKQAEQAEESAAFAQVKQATEAAMELAEGLRVEVGRQGAEIKELRAESNLQSEEIRGLTIEIRSLRSRYHAALDIIRDLLRWVSRHVHSGTDPVPTIPDIIAEDLRRS